MKISILAILIIVCVSLMGCVTTPKPWTTEEKVILGWSLLASAADWYTTTQVLDQGGYEMNPLYGKHPSNGELAAYLSLSELIVIGIVHYFPEWNSRYWLLGGKAMANTGFAIHNYGEYDH